MLAFNVQILTKFTVYTLQFACFVSLVVCFESLLAVFIVSLL